MSDASKMDFSQFFKQPEPESVVSMPADDEFTLTLKKVEELKAGRQESEIPLNDKYWDALNEHRMAGSK